MRIAVIGSGISGLTAAWLLSKRHDVVLFEKENRIGGHTNTVIVNAAEGPCPVDTGFIVYNAPSYPNLVALFDHLNVPTVSTDMSFAVSIGNGRYEYSGSSLTGLFGQPANLFNLRHWRLISETLRFFREARASIAKGLAPDLSLGEWLEERRYAKAFINDHILPMGAAIWSTPADEMMEFPFAAFARFFENHGLLQASGRPLWRTVKGGSHEYVKRLLADYSGKISVSDPVTRVEATALGVSIATGSGSATEFDAAILACHGDDALRLFSNADRQTKALLGAFLYARNHAVLHTDEQQMPRRKRVWASWNYLADDRSASALAQSSQLSVTYWMNKLQPLATKTDYFVTLNPFQDIAKDRIAAEFTYHHPMFDVDALRAQKSLWQVQGRQRVWFAGSYCGYGFHEDGAQAGLWAAEHLSATLGGASGVVARPWTVASPSGRITVPPPNHRIKEAAE